MKEHSLECDACVGDETHGKMLELKLTSAPVTTTATSKTGSTVTTKPSLAYKDMGYSENTSHVEEAMREYEKFNKGKVKENHREAWSHIARYWDYIGLHDAAEQTRNGYYRKQPNKWHWSAAFIQYCMRGNEAFKRLNAGTGKANHRHYYMAALANTSKLETLQPDDWVYFTTTKAKQIGYEMQIGDIILQRPFGKHHGDILTPEGRIGGNLGKPGSCQPASDSRASSRPMAIMTQDPKAKELLRQAGG